MDNSDSTLSDILIDYKTIVENNNLNRLKLHVKSDDIISSGSLGLILVIPRNILVNLENKETPKDRLEYVNSRQFIKSIRGYAFISYNSKDRICEILYKTSEGITIKQICNSILTYLPNDTHILIRVEIGENIKKLLKILYLYIDYGFGNPYIKDNTIILIKLNTILSHNGDDISSSSSSSSSFCDPSSVPNTKNNMVYTLMSYYNSLSNSPCHVIVKLRRKTIETLRDFCLLGSSSLNKDGSVTQKEISGKFRICKIIKRQRKIRGSKEGNSYFTSYIYLLNLDKTYNGKEQEVDTVDGLYTFHTHPKEAYIKNKVKLGIPSYNDYIGYLSSVHAYNTIFHIVATLEGMYVIKLNDYWISNFDKINNMSEFDRMKDFIKKNMNFCGKFTSVRNFLSQVNTLVYEEGKEPLFTTLYYPWKRADREMSFFYRRNNGNCFVNQKTIDIYKEMELYKK